MQTHMIPFSAMRDGDRELIDLAFSKKKADERKEWLRQYKVSAATQISGIDLMKNLSLVPS
jgi:hypothetical protein